VNSTYNSIQTGLRERKLGRIAVRRAEIELGREELKFAEEAFDQLAVAMALSP